jgi:hypothetical protein
MNNECFGGYKEKRKKPMSKKYKKIYLPTVGTPTIILKLAKKCGSIMLTLPTCFKRE